MWLARAILGPLAPSRWAERRWVRRHIFVPRSRLCCPTGCIEQIGLDGPARTLLVPTACAEWSRSRLLQLAGVVLAGRISPCARAEARTCRAAWQPTSSSCSFSRVRDTWHVPSHGPRCVTACVHLHPHLMLPCSTRRCRAPPTRPTAPPPSAARSPPPSPPLPAFFSTTPCCSRCCRCCCGVLQGGVEL